MTKDYTLAVDELRRHYVELTVLKKTVRAQVKAEFEPKIDFEIRRRIEAEEIKFANHLAAVKEREDMPINVIQDHVIRSRTWNRWEKWRDLAGLQPELVTAEDARNAKRLANRGFRWEEDPTAEIGWVFVLDRDEKGNPVPEIRIDSWLVKEDRLMAFPNNDDETRAYAGKYFGDLHGLARFVTRLATETREEIGR